MKASRRYVVFKDPSLPLNTSRNIRSRANPKFLNIHWHNQLEFLYISAGSYEIYDPDGNFIAQAGSLCLFPPGKPHCIRAVTEKSAYYTIHVGMELLRMPDGHFFQQEFVEPLYSCALKMPACLPPEQVTEQMRQALELLMKPSEKWERFQAVMILCTLLFPLCSRTPNSQPIPHGHAAVEECVRYIRTNYASKLTLEELAAHVHLHPNYLCAAFKKDIGQSIFSVITVTRIYAARKLLLSTQMTVSQVAERVGFNSPDFFCRKFKALVGISPSQYRKNN